MSIVIQLLELYIRKRDPKDIEYNEPAALLLAFMTIAISTVVFASMGIFKSAPFAATAALILDLAVSYAILHFHQKAARFIQMVTASMGVAVIGYTLILLIDNVPGIAIIQPAVEIWSVYLSIIIIRDALECTFLKAMAITFIVAIMSFFVIFQIFGDAKAIEQIQIEALQERSKKTSDQSDQVVPE